MRDYELILLFDPALGEEKISQTVAKVEEKIKTGGGEVGKTEKWGTRKLNCVIKKAKHLTQAYYVLVRFKGGGGLPGEIRSLLEVTESVARYFISLAVEGEALAEEKKEVAGAVPEAVEVEEIKGEPLGESQ